VPGRLGDARGADEPGDRRRHAVQLGADAGDQLAFGPSGTPLRADRGGALDEQLGGNSSVADPAGSSGRASAG
jgi:hypothetical protein